jgi:hypothetical protein
MFWRKKKRIANNFYVALVSLHPRCAESWPQDEEILALTGASGLAVASADAEPGPALEIVCLGESEAGVIETARKEFEERFGAWSVTDVLATEVETPGPMMRAATRAQTEDWDGRLYATAVPILASRAPDGRAEDLRWLADAWSTGWGAGAKGEQEIWYFEARAKSLADGSTPAARDLVHVGLWLRTHDGDVALWTARRLLRQEGLLLLEVLDSTPAERQGQSPEFQAQFDAAVRDGIAVAILSGPGGNQAVYDINDPDEKLTKAA